MRRSVLATLLLLTSAAVWAVDGVIEINHAKALAGGVTSGDAPGYPVTISQPGSYRLTGNIAQPDANTHAVSVTANDVSIDLNGFAILGANTCTKFAVFPPPAVTCSGPGTGNGINADVLGLTVRNGVIAGVGGSGISGPSGRIERVQLHDNGAWGLFMYTTTLAEVNASHNGNSGARINNGAVTGSVFDMNGAAGLDCRTSCAIANNTFNRNFGDGIKIDGDFGEGAFVSIANNTVARNNRGVTFSDGAASYAGLVTGNAIGGNQTHGLSAPSGNVVYGGNSFSGAVPSVVGAAVGLSNNNCNGTVAVTCP